MEQLRAELTLVLGEPVGRLEHISEQGQASLFALYDDAGQAMPLVAKYFRRQGLAAQEAAKLSMLGRESAIKVPAVYGVVISQQQPRHEVLLLERLRGVPVEAPARTPQRAQQLEQQIVECLHAWHSIDSQGVVGAVDSTQQNSWSNWYQQYVEVLWATLGWLALPGLTAEDRHLLLRCRQQLPRLFNDFAARCVLVHGNLSLQNLIKDPRSDRLIAVVHPGPILWAPREFELSKLSETGAAESLMFASLRHQPADEGFIWRRWIYLLWDTVAEAIAGMPLNRPRFDHAAQQLLPWLN
ncbi:phosphotransferase [Duffyella gerundensis]|uniref:phosphotransferase n=1 Tax=Duffyella gerundensis TaxID=1619313 RepID=UPI0016A7C7C8|nr:phosphotransferase [Duffyella gerundensis]QTO53095.1 phosphotransferase [Duffyella gerundensis]